MSLSPHAVQGPASNSGGTQGAYPNSRAPMQGPASSSGSAAAAWTGGAGMQAHVMRGGELSVLSGATSPAPLSPAEQRELRSP